jgi:hypothetical protein
MLKPPKTNQAEEIQSNGMPNKAHNHQLWQSRLMFDAPQTLKDRRNTDIA